MRFKRYNRLKHRRCFDSQFHSVPHRKCTAPEVFESQRLSGATRKYLRFKHFRFWFVGNDNFFIHCTGCESYLHDQTLRPYRTKALCFSKIPFNLLTSIPVIPCNSANVFCHRNLQDKFRTNCGLNVDQS